MRKWRYIFIALLTLCYRGLSAQEFDLYDFRYYKRFDTVEELLVPSENEDIDSLQFKLNRNFTTRRLDYNLSMIRSSRRGVPFYERKTTLNNIEIPYLNSFAERYLQFAATHIAGISRNSLSGENRLHIDTLQKVRTSAGFRFSSRNMPYSISLATAQKLPHKWSVATTITARTGRDLHIEGMFGNSLEIDAIATKQYDDNGLLSIALFAKPSMRSSRLASTKEAFRLTGDYLYNPAWGYQNGKVRNSRIHREFIPIIFAGYERDLGEQTRLNIAIMARGGIRRYSSLNWFDAQTPAPDNYRYMPSYFADDDEIFSTVEMAWLSDDHHYTQIDFDRLITSNRLNGGEAIYAIADRVKRTIHSTIRGEAVTTLSKGEVCYGIEATLSNFRNYKQMRDLLGAEFIIDLDYFLLDDDTYGNSLQNNLHSPNRHIEEGDRFGYDYAIRRYDISLFGRYHYSTTRLDIDIAAEVGYADISRRGFYRKELFCENSYGNSRHLRFTPYALHIATEYLIANNHFIRGAIATEASPCQEEELFIQSEYNNRTIDNPTLNSSYGFEFQYIFQRNNISLSATIFAVTKLNDTQVRHIYDDLSGEYSDIVINNIDLLRYGLEVETEYRFADHFRATAALTLGRYQYADNAAVTIYSDTSNIVFADHIKSNTKGLSIGNMPQIATTIGISYYNRGWWGTINANYAGLRYIDPSVVMRTERILRMAPSAEHRSAMLSQEQLGNAFTIDLAISKSIYLNRFDKQIYRTDAAPRFIDRHPYSRLIFRFGVRNLLGADEIIYNAYESSRLQRYKIADDYIYNRQSSRYIYAYPRTFYASATFTF